MNESITGDLLNLRSRAFQPQYCHFTWWSSNFLTVVMSLVAAIPELKFKLDWKEKFLINSGIEYLAIFLRELFYQDATISF